MTSRLLMFAAAVAATVAAVLASPNTPTQAFPTGAEDACAHAAWPYIPTRCIRGHASPIERVVTADRGLNVFYLIAADNLNAR